VPQAQLPRLALKVHGRRHTCSGSISCLREDTPDAGRGRQYCDIRTLKPSLRKHALCASMRATHRGSSGPARA
jgi:hypothetical protein